MLNFITKKNRIIFKSYFDCEGSKKFLAGKAKALEECVLIDEIQDKDEHNLHKKKKRHNESKHKKSKIKKILSIISQKMVLLDSVIKVIKKRINY